MSKIFNKEDLKNKAILTKSGDLPEKIEIDDNSIKIYKPDGVEEIPANSMRGKAIKDRLEFSGELTQEIYV